MRKIFIISAILILAAITFISFQWNKDSTSLNQIEGEATDLLKYNIVNFNDSLYYISETLKLYKDDFTDTERNLFLDALNKDRGKLVQYAQNLSYILRMIDIEDSLTYQSYIWKIQTILNKIYNGEITDKSKIDSISIIISKYYDEIGDIFLKSGGSVNQLDGIFEKVNSLNIEIDELLEH